MLLTGKRKNYIVAAAIAVLSSGITFIRPACNLETDQVQDFTRRKPVVTIAAFNTEPVPRAVRRFQQLQRLACDEGVDLNHGSDLVEVSLNNSLYKSEEYWSHFRNEDAGVTSPYDMIQERCNHKRHRISEAFSGQPQYVQYTRNYRDEDRLTAHFNHFIRMSHSAASLGDPPNSPLCKAKILAWTTPFAGRNYAHATTTYKMLFSMLKHYLNSEKSSCTLHYDPTEDELTSLGRSKSADRQEELLFVCRLTEGLIGDELIYDVYPTVDILLKFPNGATHIWSMIFSAPTLSDQLYSREPDWKLWEVNKEYCPPIVEGYMTQYSKDSDQGYYLYNPNKLPLDVILRPAEIEVSTRYYSLGEDFFDRYDALRDFLPERTQEELGFETGQRGRHEKPLHFE